ncbi:hypothetical protein [Acaryochloris sp. IP29b_bin.137]|uniref:hypothetical protein n=1 Tax=Acaryochloris sp. IP29b_bin.137 TaxID=2969217 RepID=UPI0026085304|nr:hypothetical protein [Acaryochloris sp. IP29b_bin.137]
MPLVSLLIRTTTLMLRRIPLLKSQQLLSSALAVCLVGILLFNNSVAALTLSLPQLAAMGASDDALDQRQRVLDEDLKIDPTKLRYRGLDYVQFQPDAERFSDAEIKSFIKSDINKDVFVAVASGSVQVFGNVQDIDVAREVVTQIKDIPGVREVMFDIGLDTKAE